MTNPSMIKKLNLDASSLDLFKSFPFITVEELTNLKAELPAYLVKVEDLDESVDKLEWWKRQETNLPTWVLL